MTNQNQLLAISPATVVSADRGLYRHVGLLAEPVPGRERHVVSLNPGTGLLEEPLSVFGRGQPLVLQLALSSLHPSIVLARARSGQHRSYSWTEFNCEHFLCFAFGTPLHSPQLQRFVGVVALTTATCLVLRARR
jgi:hypothetical protein